MNTIRIPWNDGPGNIVVSYDGTSGTSTLSVTSDTDNLGHDRRQTVTLVVADGALRLPLASADGHRLVSASGHALACLDRSMKVQLTVVQPTGMRVLISADGHALRSVNGNRLRVHPSA